MSTKEELMDVVNKWLQEEVIENKLHIITKFDGTTEIDFARLQLVNIDVSVAIIPAQGGEEEDNPVDTMAFAFDVGNSEPIELEVIKEELESGIFALANISLEPDGNAGFDLMEDERIVEDYGLSDALNHYRFGNEFHLLLKESWKKIRLEIEQEKTHSI